VRRRADLPQVAQPAEDLPAVIRPGWTDRVGTDEPLAPIEHGHSGAVPGSHLGGVRLNLMLASLAPHD
jgi:hypothetical protein